MYIGHNKTLKTRTETNIKKGMVLCDWSRVCW